MLAEITRFQAEQSLPTDTVVPEIKALTSACQMRKQALDTANTKSVAVLATQYDNALAALQRKLVQAGRLDDATAVQTERTVFTNAAVVVATKQAASITAPPPVKLPTTEQTPQTTPPPDKENIQDTTADTVKTPASPQGKTLAGTQKDDTVLLTPQSTPYMLTKGYVVPKGKELRVAAGTTIVAEKDSFVSVLGTLLVEGTEKQPVFWKGKRAGTAVWKGIRGSEVTMAYTQISGAAVALEGGSFKINDCVFIGNEIALRIWGGDNNRVENCFITKNSKFGFDTGSCEADLVNCTVSDNGIGVHHIWTGPIRIEKCVFSGNKEVGVGSASYIEAHNSVFEKNGKFDVENTPTHAKLDMDFSANWWGAQATRLLTKSGDTANLPNIQDGHDDPKAGLVQLHDFLKDRPKDCGAKIAGILGTDSKP